MIKQLLYTLLLSSSLLAQPSSKASKYLKILERKPQADYLFEKFYYTYLESDDSENLEKFLSDKAKESQVYKQLLAHFYFYEHEADKALELYNEILKVKATPEVLYRSAQIEKKNLRHKKAIEHLTKALTLKSSEKLELKVRKSLALLQFRNDKSEEALKTLKAILDKKDENLKEEVVDLLIKEGQFDEAKALISKSLKETKSPYQKVRLQLRLGDLEFQTENKEEAVAQYKKTLDSVGKDSWLTREIYNQIEHIFKSDDNISGLSDFYKSLRKDRKSDVELMKRNISVLKGLLDEKACLAEIKNLLKATPDDKENQLLYLETLSQFKKYKEALEFNRSLIKTYPKDGQLLTRLCFLLHKSNNEKEIPAVLKKYQKLSADPKFALLESVDLLKSFKLYVQAEKMLEEQKANQSEMLLQFALVDVKDKLKKQDEVTKILLEIAEKAQDVDFLQALRALKQRKKKEEYTKLIEKRASQFDKSFVVQYEYLYHLNAQKKFEETTAVAKRLLSLAGTESQENQAIQEVLNAFKRNQKTSQNLVEVFSADEQKSLLFALVKSRLLAYEKSEDVALQFIESLKSKESKIQTEKLRLLESKQDYETMISYIKETLLKQDRNKFPHYQKLVELNMQLGKYDVALKWLEEWKKFSPGSTIPFTTEANIHQQKQDVAQAIKTLKKANLRFPDNEELAQRLAQLFQWNNNYHGAAKVFWRLIAKQEKTSKKLELIRSLIQIARNKNELPTLRSELEARHDNNPKSLFPVLALAYIEKELYNYSARRDYLLEAVKIKNNDLTLMKEIAKLDEEEGHVDRAKEMYLRIAKADKSSQGRSELINFYIRNELDSGNFDLKRETASMNFSKKEIVSISENLFVTDFVKMEDFLSVQTKKKPEDYQVAYLYAISLSLNEKFSEAADFLLALKETKQEMKKPFKTQQNNRYYGSFSYYSCFSSEVQEYYRFSSFQHVALSYKNHLNNLQHLSSNFRSNRQQLFNLPSSLQELEHYCLHLLIQIHLDAEEDLKKDLHAKISALNAPHVNLHLEIMQEGNNWQARRRIMLDKFLKDPENKLVRELCMMQIQDADFKKLTKEQINNVLKSYTEKEKINKFSFIARALKADAIPQEPYFKQFLQFIEEQNVADQGYLFHVYGLVSHNKQDKVSFDTKALLQSFYKAFVKNKDELKGHARGQNLSSIIRAAFQVKHYDLAIKYIDDELMEIQKDPKLKKLYTTYQQNFYGYSRYSHRHGNQPLFTEFKGQSNALFPIAYSSYFNQQSNQHNNVKLDKEEILKLAPTVKSSALKVAIYDFAGQSEKVTPLLDEIVKNKKNKDSLAFALNFASYKKDTEGMIKYLTLLKDSLKGKERQKIIYHLIYHASQSENLESKKMALAECKKLLNTRLNSAAKGELATYFEKLGDKDSANKLDQELRASLSKNQRSQTRSSSGRRYRSPIEKIENELRQNNDEATTERLLKQSLRYIQQYSRTIFRDKRMNNQYRYENLIRNIGYKKLTEKSIELLMKDRELTAPLLCAKAIIYEFNNDESVKKKAIPVYREALKLSQAKSIHLRLAFLLMSDDSKQALKHLEIGVNNSLTTFFQTLQSNHQLTNKLENLLLLEKFVNKKVAALDKHKLQRLNYSNFLYRFTNSTNYKGQRIPYLFSTDLAKKIRENSTIAEGHKLRIEAYKRSISAYAKYPELAAQLFNQISLNSQAPHADMDQFCRDLALKILKKDGLSYNYGSSSNGNYRSQSPFMTVLTSSHTKVEILALKEFIKDKKIAEFFCSSLIKISESPKEQILANVKDLLEAPELKDQQVSTNHGEDNRTLILQWLMKSKVHKSSLLGLSSLMETEIAEVFKKDKENMHHNLELSFFRQWAKLVGEDKKEVVKLYKVILKGINDAVALRMKEHNSKTFAAFMNSGNYYKYTQEVRNIFDQKLRDRDPKVQELLNYFYSLETINEASFIQRSNIEYNLKRYNREMVDNFNLFSKSSMLKDLDEFAVIGETDSNRSILVNIKYRNYKNQVEKLKLNTFGSRLVLSLYANKPSEALLSFLDKEFKNVEKLNQKTQEDLFEATHDFVSRNGKVALIKNYPNLQKFLGANIEKQLAKKIKELEDTDLFVSHNVYEYTQRSAKTILQLIESNEEKAGALFKSISRKIQSYNLRRGNTRNRSASEELIERIRSASNRNYRKLAFCFKLLPFVTFKDPNNRIEEYLTNDFSYALRKELEDQQKSLNKDKKKNSHFEAFKLVYAEFPQDYDYESNPILTAFRYPFQRMPKQELDLIKNFTKENKSVLAQDIFFTASLARQQKESSKDRNNFDSDFVAYLIERGEKVSAGSFNSLVNQFGVRSLKYSKEQGLNLLRLTLKVYKQSAQNRYAFQNLSAILQGFREQKYLLNTEEDLKLLKASKKTWLSSFNSRSHSSISSYSDDRLILLYAVCQSKDESLIKEVLADSNIRLKAYPETYLILLQNGFTNLAEKLLKDSVQSISFQARKQSEYLDRNELKKQLSTQENNAQVSSETLLMQALIVYGLNDQKASSKVAQMFVKRYEKSLDYKTDSYASKAFEVLLHSRTDGQLESFYISYFDQKRITYILSQNNTSLHNVLADYITGASTPLDKAKISANQIINGVKNSNSRYYAWRLADNCLEDIAHRLPRKEFGPRREETLKFIANAYKQLDSYNNGDRTKYKMYWLVSLYAHNYGVKIDLKKPSRKDSDIRYAFNDIIKQFAHKLDKAKVATWLQEKSVKDLVKSNQIESYWNSAVKNYSLSNTFLSAFNKGDVKTLTALIQQCNYKLGAPQYTAHVMTSQSKNKETKNQLLAKITDPALKYFAEVYLNSFRYTKIKENSTGEKKEELLLLLKQFPEKQKILSKEQTQQIRRFFASRHWLAQQLPQDIGSAYNKQTDQELLSFDDWSSATGLTVAIQNCLYENKQDEALKIYKRLGKLSKKHGQFKYKYNEFPKILKQELEREDLPNKQAFQAFLKQITNAG